MNESISFDRAARTYDRTRAMSSEARARVADILQEELFGRGQVLEVGVGTGRIALPLHERGLPLSGVDLSAAMLEQLIDNAGGTRPFPLGRADATKLPFRDGNRVFAAHGFAERQLPEVVSKEEQASPADYLRTFSERTWSWTWDLTDEQIEHAVRNVGEWVRKRFGDPDEPIPIEFPIRWSAFEPAP